MSHSITATYHRWPFNVFYEGGRRVLEPQGLKEPKVSIVTVCYNAVRTIEQTILSVCSQRFENYEYLIIDGGSSDGTLDIIRKYETQLEYILSSPDTGIYDAMNRGLALSHGDYIIFLNADDWYNPDAIATLISRLETGTADFVSAGATICDAGGMPIKVHPTAPFNAVALLRMPLRHETMLIPRKIYNALGLYDTNYKILSDRKFTADLFLAGYRHEFVNMPILNFRNSGISNTTRDLLLSERLSLLKTYFPQVKQVWLEQLADLEHLTSQSLFSISQATDNRQLQQALRAYAKDKGWEKPDNVTAPWRFGLKFGTPIKRTFSHIKNSFRRGSGNT